MNQKDKFPDYLAHIGVKRRSGRYPWGSGDDPYQRSGDILSRIDELKKHGITSEKDIASAMELENTTELRTLKAWAISTRRATQVAKAKDLRDKGYSLRDTAEKMGLPNESSVRSLLNIDAEARMNQAQKTADFLKKQIDEKGMIDVGVGVERQMGNVSPEKMKQALYLLEMDGYPVWGGRMPQATNPGKFTTIKVACPPGTEHKEIYNYDKIHYIDDHITKDGGETFQKYRYPKSMDSKRLEIKYAEDGGIDKDGVIEIRRNVPDLSLGNSHYAQVRILVDDKRYLKGMAVYSDDLPDGIDVRFNTNKPKSVPKMEVLKKIKDDPDNPFGALLRQEGGQSDYIGKDGKKHQSLINKTREEGDWEEWADRLSSQFLSKQNKSLIKKQLGLAAADKMAEFEEINSLTNPTVKKRLLQSFSDDCDSAAVHLYAAALPGQKYQVLLPVPTLNSKQIYAPNYEEGTEVALIRYPHGGTFEIPILTVNNRSIKAKKMMGNALDAVGVNKEVADRLSGADFDGDTAMVIPLGKGVNRVNITSTRPLTDLEGFDPKYAYPYRDGMKIMKNTQTEMGKISNLITDMTLKGASESELARAVKHSMVVIDAEKHKLDYTQSYVDNDIATLKKIYQSSIDPVTGREHQGASTLISRAKSKEVVLKRQGSPRINEKGKPWYDPSKPEGAQIWKSVEERYIGKDGKEHFRTQNSTKMFETDDARTLSSGTAKEELYADFANRMKSLANEARKEMIHTGRIEYSSDAKKEYLPQVSSLMGKLNNALLNAPRERRAQAIANSEVQAKKESNPYMTKKDLKKAKQVALTNARARVGAKRETITITNKEWEAIQAGAISETKLSQILNHTDIDSVRQLATPHSVNGLSPYKINRIHTMKESNQNYTNAQIADALGVSVSTVVKELKKE